MHVATLLSGLIAVRFQPCTRLGYGVSKSVSHVRTLLLFFAAGMVLSACGQSNSGSAVGASAAVASVNAAIVPAGLVAAYNFNEGAGSAVTDLSGNGNTGTISGATWTTSGKFGNALVFNGNSAVVTVPNTASLRLTTGMTLEAWVYPTSTPTGWRSVIDKNLDGYYLMASTNVGNRPSVGGTWVGGNQNTVGPSTLAVNSWTHLAATFDGSTARLFVNGTQVAAQAQTTALVTTSGTLQIGGNSYPNEFFAGVIDEVRIYNRALTAAELQADMSSPAGGAGQGTASAPATADTAAPSAPGSLSAKASSLSQLNLAWGASSDAVGVTGYRLERCQGAGCTTFTQVAAPSVSSFSDTGLTANTPYTYRVRAVDAAGNLSGYSAPATFNTATFGLVAAYNFNEGSGTTVTDASGNGNTGTISGATWASSGKFGNALVFNGTGAQVTVPNAASLQLTNGMTLEAWVFPTSTPTSWRAVVDKNVDGYFLMASTDQGNRPGVGGTWGSGGQKTYAPSVLGKFLWTHLAATYDGAAVRLFVNGTQVASQAQTTPLAVTNGTLQIGGDAYPNEFFAGLIDEVRIYNRALSIADLQIDMNTGIGVAPSADTTAPTVPTGLTATVSSVSQINLGWNASTDGVGVTGYRLERCQGAGCTAFSQVAAPTVPSFVDSGLSANTSYTYRVRATDAAGNLSGYSSAVSVTTSSSPAPDTTAPTVRISSPASGSTVSATTVVTAIASDNIGVAGVQFLLDGVALGAEQGAPYSISWNTTTSGNGTHTLSARARDAAGNATVATNITVTVSNAQASSGLVAAYNFNEGAGTTVTDLSGNGNTGTISGATWTTSGKFGKALVFNGTGAQVTVPNAATLRLTTGMTLEAWVYPTSTPNGWRAVIDKNLDGYYLMASTNVGNRPSVGGTWVGGKQNTVGPSTLVVNAWTHLAATFDGATTRLFVNGTQVAAQAQSTALANSTGTLQIGGDSYPNEFFAGVIDEVRIYNRALSAAELQADMNSPAGGGAAPSNTTPPTVPAGLTATVAGLTQINLAWSASTNAMGVTGYRLERCQGTGCSTFAQIASPTVTTFSDGGLTANTSYTYRVRATDAAGNLSGYSASVSATTTIPDSIAPSVPAGLTATTISSTQINLAWTASTDNVGVTGYVVKRNGVQVATPTATSYSDTALTGSTAYTYTVAARDAAGNLSANSASVAASTATTGTQLRPVISANKRYLQDQNGNPFPILGRTAWFITSLSVADYKAFIDDTVAKGYNAIEFHVINHDSRGNNPPFAGNGSAPFSKALDGSAWSGSLAQGNGTPDFSQPNETYWAYVDALLTYAESKGILCFMFPAYVGAVGSDDGWMNEMITNGTAKMQAYGAFIANRYRSRGNIVWMLGGDRGQTFTSSELPPEQAMLAGMKSVASQSSLNFSAEWGTETIYTDQTDATLRAAGTLQGAYSWTGNVNTFARKGYAYSPTMPTFLLEEPYDEEGPDGNGYNPSATQPVRRFQWGGWLSSIGGYISGNGYVWTFTTGWKNHLNTQGAQDMARLNAFIRSIAWYNLVPSGLGGMKTLVTAGGSSPSASDYVTAAATPDGSLLVAYIPPAHSGSITVDLTAMSGTARARWFNPTTAAYTTIGTFANTGASNFTPPGNNGTGYSDWVLILDKQ